MTTAVLQSNYLQFLNGTDNNLKLQCSTESNYSRLSFSTDQSNGILLKGLANPVDNTDACNKAYVDSLKQGLRVKDAVKCLLNSNLAGNYTTNTLTKASNGQLANIDGVALSVNDRILLTGQTDQKENGIWYVSVLGDASNAWVLERPSDFDSSSEIEGAFCFISEGNSYSDTGWVCSSDNVTLGSSNLTFVQFSQAGVINAGDGLLKVGNDLSVNVDSSTIEIASDTLQVKDSGLSGDKLQSSFYGDALVNASGVCNVNVDGSSIEVNSDALRVKALGIASSMIADNAVTNSKMADDSVNTSQILDNAITNAKLSDDCVNTAEIVNDAVTNVKILDGTISNAKLAGSIANAKLVNSSITVSDSTNSEAIALGDNLEFKESTNMTVSYDSANNRFSFSVIDAPVFSGAVQGLSFTSTSDRRLKKNITLIKNPIEKLNSINGYSYKWDNERYGNDIHYGVIAQECDNLIPEVVKNNNNKLSVDYNGLIGVLIEGMKEQQKQINELKQQIELI